MEWQWKRARKRAGLTLEQMEIAQLSVFPVSLSTCGWLIVK